MRELLRRALCVLCMLSAAVAAAAEKVTFEAAAPLLVAKGERFRIEFTLNDTPDAGTFRAPDFTGFDILADNIVSTGTQWAVVNGQMAQSVSYTISYVLQAPAAGKYSIGEAEISVKGKSYKSAPLLIEVVEEAPSSAGGRRPGQQPREGRQPAPEQAVAKDDLLLRMLLDRTTVYKGQPIRATFKLYRRVPLVGSDGARFPSFNGFWAQQINPENNQWQRESFKGKVYETLVVNEYLLYPQQVGALQIEGAEMTAVVQVVANNPANFDPIFGSMPEIYEVRRKLTTAPATVTVRELPAGAPAGFNGAVGSFTMDSELPPSTLQANASATYTIKITGTGNLPFVQAPQLTLPTSFELYNVKTTESLKSGSGGISGYRKFEYPFIARAEGSYTIPAVEFTYFNPALMKYVTLSTREMQIDITPDASGSGGQSGGIVGGLSKEEVKVLGQDIRFIKIGRAGLRPSRTTFMFSTGYWALLAASALLFAAALVYLRKRIREMQNATLVRGRRANKVALQRFRAAERYMHEGRQHLFYEEMLRALWGYMSDKLNIPVANLTKENVREELRKRGVAPDQAQRYIDIIAACDEAQYSPMASSQMNEVYAQGVAIISRFESTIKNKKQQSDR